MNSLMLFPREMRMAILIFAACLMQLSVPVQELDTCLYGKQPSVAAESCREILDVQPECYGETGIYWLKKNGDEYEAYCDMDFKGGGWLRVVSHHQDENTTCPQGWVNLWVDNSTKLYCLRGNYDETDVPKIRWNTDGHMEYSEVRGYVIIRMKGGGTPDCFSSTTVSSPLDTEVEYMDGVAIEVSGTHPRHIFSYVVGTENNGKWCPVPGTSQASTKPQFLRPFAENSFACSNLDKAGETDDDGYLTSAVHSPTTTNDCAQCASGMPWFMVSFGEALRGTLQVRMMDGAGYDPDTAVTDMEVYVR